MTAHDKNLQADSHANEHPNGDSHHHDGYRIPEVPMGTRRPVKVIFIGMGISGVNFAREVKLNTNGVQLAVYEKNPQLGGTWYENRYPGCACDIPSIGYQFSWDRNPNWSRYYSSSREINEYVNSVARKFDLLGYVKFDHRIVGADWIENEGHWKVTVMRNNDPHDLVYDYGEFLLNGSGVLNKWRWPDIKGLHEFQGELTHSACYNQNINLEGKKVLIIGAGSSSVQIVPSIINKVDKLHLVVRSPIWITAGFAPTFAGPDGQNFEYSESMKRKLAEDPNFYLRYCKAVESELNIRFKFLLNGTPAAKEAKKYSRESMERALAGRQDLMDILIPKNFNVGCRRPTPGNGFLEALCEEKTHVIKGVLQEVTTTGFIGPDGTHHEVDVIICATGFDTSFCPQFPITCNGFNLQDRFQTKDLIGYLGLSAPEIPNYFVFIGPYGPLGHGSVVPMVEAYSKYILKVIDKFRHDDVKKMQVKMSSAVQFTRHADQYLKRTAWSGPCSSWFKNGDVARKPVLWPGSRIHYLTVLEQPRWEDFDFTYRSDNQFGYLGDGFATREFDGRDLTWYYGSINGEDKQPEPFTPDLASFWTETSCGGV